MKILELPQDLVEAGEEPGVCHRVCRCNENVAICGEDVSEENLIEWDEVSPEPDCLRCVTLTRFWLCPICAKGWDEE